MSLEQTHMHTCAHVHTHTPLIFFMTWKKDGLFVEIRDSHGQLESV